MLLNLATYLLVAPCMVLAEEHYDGRPYRPGFECLVHTSPLQVREAPLSNGTL